MASNGMHARHGDVDFFLKINSDMHEFIEV